MLVTCFFFAVVAAEDFFFRFFRAATDAARCWRVFWVFAECWVLVGSLADGGTAACSDGLVDRFFRAIVLPVRRFRG